MQPDELNRKPLAVTIWNLIKDNPMEGSTRIGVYGAWKEYEGLIERWKTDSSPANLEILLSDQVRQVSTTTAKGVKEFWEMTLHSREKALSQAAECATHTEQQAHLKAARGALRLLEIAAHDLKMFSRSDRPLDSSDYLSLYRHCSGWAHFAVPVEVYSDVRNAEQNLLVRAAQECKHLASEIVEKLEPWQDNGWPHPQVQVLKQVVIEAFIPAIVEDLHARFSTYGGIHALWPREKHYIEKYYLLRRESGFYSLAGLANLENLSEQAREKVQIQENFMQYLQLIDYALRNKLGIVSATDTTPLAQDTNVIGLAWKAVVANPLQLRMIGSLKDTRAKLAETAESDEHLPLPSWWNTAR